MCIFEKIENVISHNQIPWDKCVAFSVDNASVNMGKRNSIKSRVLVKNPDVYFVGCSCHMTHNAAHKGRDNFLKHKIILDMPSEVNILLS
jgi:hypothetical protein